MPSVNDSLEDLPGVEEISRVDDLPGWIAPPGTRLGWERYQDQPGPILTLADDHYAIANDNGTGVLVGHREDLIAWLGSARDALVRERDPANRRWAK